MKRFLLVSLAFFVLIGGVFSYENIFFQISDEEVFIPSSNGGDTIKENWGGFYTSIRLGNGKLYPIASIFGGGELGNGQFRYGWAKMGLGVGGFNKPYTWSVLAQANLADFDAEISGYISAPVTTSGMKLRLFSGVGVILPFVDKTKSFATNNNMNYSGFWVEPGAGVILKNDMELGLKVAYQSTNQLTSDGKTHPSMGIEFYQCWIPELETFVAVKWDGWHLTGDGNEQPMYHIGARLKL